LTIDSKIALNRNTNYYDETYYSNLELRPKGKPCPQLSYKIMNDYADRNALNDVVIQSVSDPEDKCTYTLDENINDEKTDFSLFTDHSFILVDNK